MVVVIQSAVYESLYYVAGVMQLCVLKDTSSDLGRETYERCEAGFATVDLEFGRRDRKQSTRRLHCNFVLTIYFFITTNFHITSVPN
jgi:hypothetical protein